MKTHARVVVIGGGVVGASVLYHLTKAGWRDVVLVERSELTSGSTWHAAGGMHTVNGDPNVAKLQDYTINLYKEIEAISGQSCGIHITAGLMLACTPERLDFLKMMVSRASYLGLDMEMVSVDEAAQLLPADGQAHFVGALYNTLEGHVDPSGVTHAYAKAARIQGAEVYRTPASSRRNPRPDGSWDVVTDKGTIVAEHVVNAGGLWAREVGRMVGLELPVLAMEHQYLITEDMPEVAASRQGDAAYHRFRRRDLHAPGGPRRHADRHLRARRRAVVGAADALGLRPRAAAERPRPHRAEPRGRLRAFPGARARRHQARRQRPLHLRARRQPAGRAGAGPQELLGRLRRDGRVQPGRRRRAVACRTG